MATFISLHIKSDNRAFVGKLIQELSDVNHITYGSYPNELDENILPAENANPNFIAIGDIQNGWISVQLNSFKKLHDWAKKISKELNTLVVQVVGQTASDAYYFLMYDKGELRREIEIYYGELDNLIDKGEKFAFEKPSLVPLNDDDYENLFNGDTLEQYCKELGFDLFNDVQPEFYYILKNKNLYKTLSEVLASKKKRWWRFW